MAKIFPIKGIMYNVEQDDNLGKYLCPPFDVVDNKDIERLYESSKYNVIRLENGKTFNSDDEKENKYSRASQFFNDWISSDILKKEDNESLFILQEIFKNGEEELTRCSLICSVKVENYENKFYVLSKDDELISTYEKIHNIFDKVIGKKDVPDYIEYIHDNNILKGKIEKDDIQISFFMNALSKEYFLNCVSQGKLLPPKSTLFYPKLPTGLVIQYFDE